MLEKKKTLHPDYIFLYSIVFVVEDNKTNILNKISILLIIEDDPKTHKDAMMSWDVTFWKDVVNDEMDWFIII